MHIRMSNPEHTYTHTYIHVYSFPLLRETSHPEHTYIHTHIHTYIHIHSLPLLRGTSHPEHTYIHTYIHTYMYTVFPCFAGRAIPNMHTYIHTYMYTVFPYSVRRAIPSIHTYIHTYIHTVFPYFARRAIPSIHTYIHTYIHTCTQSSPTSRDEPSRASMSSDYFANKVRRISDPSELLAGISLTSRSSKRYIYATVVCVYVFMCVCFYVCDQVEGTYMQLWCVCVCFYVCLCLCAQFLKKRDVISQRDKSCRHSRRCCNTFIHSCMVYTRLHTHIQLEDKGSAKSQHA